MYTNVHVYKNYRINVRVIDFFFLIWHIHALTERFVVREERERKGDYLFSKWDD